jgi:hypothetical protein
MDELEDGDFFGNYPLWTCVGRENPRTLMCRGTIDEYHRFVGIFTDEDLLERFITELQIEHAAVKLQIANIAEFLIFLGGALLAGATHVFFDPPPKGGPTRYTGTIALIVETLGKHLRFAPASSRPSSSEFR